MVCFWGQILATSKNGKTQNNSYSVWPCLCRMKTQEQLPYVPLTQIFSAKSGKINLFALRHFLFPFMGSRQNLPQWGMKTTCSPLPMSSWNQPLDSSFCQVISSHHESRWYNFFPSYISSSILKKRAPKAMFYYFSVRALSSGKDVICLYVWVIKHSKRLPDFCLPWKHCYWINTDKYFKIFS